ncbi:MerR family transcriptional regulator [Actinomyces timonensis]|uniref:MerR family transcriptional regulator n=1 Tax=Actinomyces timonensis TaxID=1288391 RepID=A0AAU8N2T6_9ACTO
MRVAEIARLTGTTVRAVRHYHSLGLLPVPAERGGWRDYDLSHVARLSRIRWLVRAGVPLSAVARVLDGAENGGPGADHAPTGADDGPVSRDLAAALTSVEAHLEEVAAQRDMLAALLERAREGMSVSPMPPRMAAFFDRMEAAAPDERTRAAVRADRDAVDLACYRGQMPAEAELLFPDPGTDDDAATLADYGRAGEGLDEEEAEAMAAEMLNRLMRRAGPERLRALARSADREAIRALFQLFSSFEQLGSAYARALERGLLEAIDDWGQGRGPGTDHEGAPSAP